MTVTTYLLLGNSQIFFPHLTGGTETSHLDMLQFRLFCPFIVEQTPDNVKILPILANEIPDAPRYVLHICGALSYFEAS